MLCIRGLRLRLTYILQNVQSFQILSVGCGYSVRMDGFSTTSGLGFRYPRILQPSNYMWTKHNHEEIMNVLNNRSRPIAGGRWNHSSTVQLWDILTPAHDTADVRSLYIFLHACEGRGLCYLRYYEWEVPQHTHIYYGEMSSTAETIAASHLWPYMQQLIEIYWQGAP